MSAQKLDPVNQMHIIVVGLAMILIGSSLFVGDALIPRMVVPGAIVVALGFAATGISFLRFPNVEHSWGHATAPPNTASA